MTSTLLRGGTVHTPADPFATAVLVVDDRVAWVGGEGAAATHADGVDVVVDLGGALVTPAFVDAHVHTTETGLAMAGVDLRDARSVADVLDRVSAWARARPGEPVLGAGWDELGWPDPRPPTGEELDRAAGGAVAYLARVDVHSAVVSSALLDRAPSVREADGYEASGRVRRTAHHLARTAARSLVTSARRQDLQLAALRRAASLGIACVHEIAAPHITVDGDLDDLRAVLAAEPLPDVVPYWGQLAGDGGVERVRSTGAAGAAGDLVVDGSLGSRTALLTEPYADEPGSRGARYVDLEQATEHLVACTRAGIQGGFHAIGDRAVRTAVEALVGAAETCGQEAVVAARHRFEHLELVDPELVPRLARLGAVASIQPAFDAAWGGPDGMYAARLGRERALAMNPFADLARAGVALAFGSDSPVTPLGPWAAVRAAAGHHVPEQRLTVRAAFSAHTRGGWRAARRDDAGVLAPGQLASYAVWDVPAADLVVATPDARVAAWSTDPRAGVPGLPELGDGRPDPVCLRTVASGRVVHDAGALVERGS